MKWESVDINVVEQVNTVKFSKLDNIGAPLRLFELLFDNVLVDMIVSYTKCSVIQRKRTLVWKWLKKHFAYS